MPSTTRTAVQARPPRNPARDLFFKKLDDLDSSRRVTQKIVRFFPNTDMRNGHDGLAKIAQKNDVDINRLRLGEFIVFVNKARTTLKLYAPNYIIVHQRLPNGAVLDLRVIERIPKYFDGSRLNYDGALKEVILKELGK